MAGELTTSTISYVDINDDVAVAAAIDALVLTAVTDHLFVIPLPTQHKVAIFSVVRAP